MVGRDPLLPPDGSLPHAYGAAGRNRPRNALALPRASHIWFVVRELPPTANDGPDRDLLFQVGTEASPSPIPIPNLNPSPTPIPTPNQVVWDEVGYEGNLPLTSGGLTG